MTYETDLKEIYKHIHNWYKNIIPENIKEEDIKNWAKFAYLKGKQLGESK